MDNTTFYKGLDAFVQGAVPGAHLAAKELCLVGRVGRNPHESALLKQAPIELWKNIIPTVMAFEWLRDALGGKPIRVLSGYRDPEYNRVIDGATRSMHVEFNALDLQCDHATPREMLRKMLQYPKAHRMGIGHYASFLHIDTRGYLGRLAPARWGIGF